jgi:hypothetical protein
MFFFLKNQTVCELEIEQVFQWKCFRYLEILVWMREGFRRTDEFD